MILAGIYSVERTGSGSSDVTKALYLLEIFSNITTCGIDKKIAEPCDILLGVPITRLYYSNLENTMCF